MEKRILELDFIRGLCIVYIVGVWHFNNYLAPQYHYSPNAAVWLEYITVSVLSAFTFLSGFLLKKYSFTNKKSVLAFYNKRILRFWPLFVLSAASLCFIRYINVNQFIWGICGLALFTQEPMKTLWFISMMMFLYATTPLVRWTFKSDIINIIIVLSILLLLTVMFVVGSVDERLIRYAPLYYLGLFSNEHAIKRKNWWLVLFSSLCFLVIAHLFLTGVPVTKLLIIAISGCAIVFSAGYLIPIPRSFCSVIGFFSYASMAAYLFHRIIFAMALFVFGIKGCGEPYLPLGIAIITLCCVFIVSWLIQNAYDRILKRLVQ